MLRKRDMREHPNSGAGSIKHDGSDEDTVVEVKDAGTTYRLHARELRQSHQHAAEQSREMLWLIRFEDERMEGFVAEVRIVPERGA